MATAAIARGKDINFAWEGKDKSGKIMRGEMRAPGEAMVNATLRRQGIIVTKVKKQRAGRGGSVSDKDDDSLAAQRSEEHTSELQSRPYLVCRLLLVKKNKQQLRLTI